ncbi:hypothetical protein [Rosenbergiella nectarea]|uniref:hypothetical protein n=1 Tax=Rosenbergiella nectarea TaxID=988801 RepID=UPI001F4EC284|nr:hypothetical protein [Rosenbergiella nectarea]
MKPQKGLLTFMAEGNNSPTSQYYSRKLHWPGISLKCSIYRSGVTLGRGYDMKYRTVNEIVNDLTYSGIPIDKARAIAQGSKKHSCSARDFVIENRKKITDITEIQQLNLFNLTYSRYEVDSMRFYNKYKTSTSVLWEALHPILKDVLVDMKYQGVLSFDMVPIFGLNCKDRVIELLKNNQATKPYEASRGRIAYIEGNIS